MPTPKVLIEDWLPIEAIGAESLRDASAARKPPLNRLHVWWARRPLTVSRAAIVGSILPQWSADWPESLREKFPTEASYHAWFLRFLGIFGDPVAGRKLIRHANEKGLKLQGNPYGYPRAFSTNPSAEDLQTMGDLLELTWGTRDLSVLDPFAGGGSIPFESLRYGFTTIANDLNPVAATILKATLDYPARFGPELAEDIKKWGNIWAKRVEEKLADYFPKQANESIFAYLWARTVACPTTGKPVPLSPNWWLSKGSEATAVHLITTPHLDAPEFRIVTGEAARQARPDEGTISRGNGRSPWTGETIPGDYIKNEAQNGRMGQILYAVAIKKPGGFAFRAPTAADLAAAQRAEAELNSQWLQWQLKGIAIDEDIPYGHRANERDIIVQYGETKWQHMFNNRQLFALTVYLETLSDLYSEILNVSGTDKAVAIKVCLSLAFDKAVIYNNRHCRFDIGRGIRSIFDRHDFAFTWSHAEFDAAANLLPWVISQVADAIDEIAKLRNPVQLAFDIGTSGSDRKYPEIIKGTANSLNTVASGTIQHICVDPPYYNNVNYAELSDFFYVWLKRSLSESLPQFFTDELTNKDEEAVANPARFHDGVRGAKKKKELAEQDYEHKMAAAFREMHRVLHPHGVLTVMFTHKRVEAWDTLASALIGAGFTIKASWPVHTESEHSLHQAKKNAAASTILLVCRKRISDFGLPISDATPQSAIRTPQSAIEPVWWDDIQGRVRRVAREKAQEYAQQGISGVDLYISAFGPALSVISENWPVLTSDIDPKTGQPKPLRPETALDLAREEVIRLRKEGLLNGRALTFDPVTDWYLMAWDAFKAEEFPYDEARKLAIALGLEIDALTGQKKLIAKKSASVVLQTPIQRRKKGLVDPDAAQFDHLLDALHTAMLIYEEDGAGACDLFLQNRGLKRDATFRAGLQALLNAIPRTKVKNQFVRPEADVLDRIRLTFYADELTVPPEEEPAVLQATQLDLFSADSEVNDIDEDDEEEEI